MSVPSAPAGICRRDPVARERRRGRGTLPTPGPLRPIARIAFDDGWQSLEERRRSGTTTIDSTRRSSRVSRRTFLRPLDQSLVAAASTAACIVRAADDTYLGHRPGSIRSSCSSPDVPHLLERGFRRRATSQHHGVGTNTDPTSRSSASIR